MVTYRFGPFSVKDNESLWIDDTLVPLSPLQLRLLSYLCSHPQQVLDKERIVINVWGRSDVSDVSLARAIHGLRNRLAAGSRANELIRNIYGRGYMLTQPVTILHDTSTQFCVGRHGDGDGPAATAAAMAQLREDQDRPISAVATLPRMNLRAVH
jgi:DNA-binding winged helix-turn-helix (wHTH) protein